ncbi:hypothetical protein KY338_05260 [Candidatus Woesearchaeota archaeon]|nr:hypothetical protein [Candidatus Woesearchaeota archaeon]MBW3005559.1 hypothetical protein [Candidatus Woesearchaeota archaeon]
MIDDKITVHILVKEVDTCKDMRVVITDKEENIVFTDLEGISEDMYKGCSLVTKKAAKIGKPTIPSETGKPFPFTANPTYYDIAHVQYTAGTTTQNTENYFVFCSQQEPLQRLDSLKKSTFFAVGIRQIPTDLQRLLLVDETNKKLIATFKTEGTNTNNPTSRRVPDDPRDLKYI